MEKSIHIVFQVLNFLHGSLSKEYQLSEIAKLVLINLASHKGQKGIYPSISTMCRELKLTKWPIIKALQQLEKTQLIVIIKSPGLSNHYELNCILFSQDTGSYPAPVLSTGSSQPTTSPPQTSSQSATSSQLTGSQPATGTGSQPTTGTSSWPATLYNKVNNKDNKTERARKTRVLLPLSFKPDLERQSRLEEVSRKTGRSQDEIMIKFRNVQKSKGFESADWQAEFENFLLNEKPALQLFNGAKGIAANEVRCTVPEWGRGHPGWEALHGAGQKREPF